jgi:hypothetical protein
LDLSALLEVSCDEELDEYGSDDDSMVSSSSSTVPLSDDLLESIL